MDNTDLTLLFDVLRRHPEAAEPLGLFLTPDLKPSGYRATPACCRTFAWTGGDGVHFSLAKTGADRPPVVMTVPMNFDAPNIVAGADLSEFLSLGLRTGYYVLENLVYQRDAAIFSLTNGVEIDEHGLSALEDIEKSFSLLPWSNVRDRLAALQVIHAQAIK